MSESEVIPERSEEETTEERIFNMMQSVMKEMKDTWGIENLSNIEIVHLKKIVSETLESRDQIEGMRQRILEEDEEGIKVTKNRNADIGSTVQTEIIIRWLDQLYGIDPVKVRNLYRQSQFLQMKLDDKTSGERIILRRTGIDYQKYDEKKRIFETTKHRDIFSEADYDDTIVVFDKENQRRETDGHETRISESHDDRLLDYINRKREEAHLM